MGFVGALLLGTAAGLPGSRVPLDHDVYHQKTFRLDAPLASVSLTLLDSAGGRHEVRLLGVDFSTNSPPAAATVEVGEEVTLLLEDVPTRNSVGEVLAYVFLPDGSLLNEQLVAQGRAYVDRRYEFAYRRTFEQAEEAAFKKELGLWAEHDESAMPGWRQRWLAELRKPAWERTEWRRPDEP